VNFSHPTIRMVFSPTAVRQMLRMKIPDPHLN